MQASPGKTIARLGGAALAISVLLPWFKLEIQQFGSMGFSLREMDRNAAIGLALIGVFCAVQPRISAADASAMIYTIVGLLVTGAIIYKVFVSPPGSGTMSELSLDGVSIKDLLNSIGIDFNPTYGAFLGIAGGAAITIGSFIDLRTGGVKTPAVSLEMLVAESAFQKAPVRPKVLAPGQQRYVAPQASSGFVPAPMATGPSASQQHPSN
ncbi:MAG: hypothetical protein ACPGWS_05785 [Solirubrobacterales bacterium]